MVLDTLQRWAVNPVALKRPKILTLRIQGGVDDFGDAGVLSQVDLSPLRPPAATGDLATVFCEVHPQNLVLTQPLSVASIDSILLQAPIVQSVSLDALWNCPQILDLFTGITSPGSAGKAYSHLKDTREVVRSTKGERVPLVTKRCRHGIPTDMCATCEQELAQRSIPTRRRRKESQRPRTLNVFDLLLPYLQPSIETLLLQPVLFPDDRRPYDYQIQGISFLVEHPSALLGDEMGLGKTVQTIVALQVLFRRGEIFRVLVLCRRSLSGTWEHELHKWAPEFFVLRVRGTRDERDWLWKSPASVYLTTYETARQDILRKQGLLPRFDIVVLDEIQEIKNPSAKKTRAVRRLESRYRWGLSGTPLENKPEDVISIFHYLQPGLFRRDTPYSPLDIKRRIRPYFLRRHVGDVLTQLPEKKVEPVWLDLTDAQRRTYDTFYSHARAQLARPGATRTHVFSMIGELKKICNQDPVTGESCKLEYLQDQLDNTVESGQKALVFSHLPNVTLKKIQPKLMQFSPAIFDGSLSDAQREAMVTSGLSRIIFLVRVAGCHRMVES
jgi:superfamily II DNA or RNA helicase